MWGVDGVEVVKGKGRGGSSFRSFFVLLESSRWASESLAKPGRHCLDIDLTDDVIYSNSD